MEEYENLKEMVQMKLEEEREYLMFGSGYRSFVWIEEINSKTSRKGNYYKPTT